MSQLLSEAVVEVPPLSLKDVERRSAEVRALLVSLTKAMGPALPWDELVDRHGLYAALWRVQTGELAV